jgi:GNAT superfamily N-acetyltransferase
MVVVSFSWGWLMMVSGGRSRMTGHGIHLGRFSFSVGSSFQRRGFATRLLSKVIANAPQSIGSQNSEKIEHTSATIAIHAKMRM